MAIKMTLDLNGHTLSSDGQATIKINNPEAELSIMDSSAEKSGKVVNTNESQDNGMCVWARRGKAIIEGGEYCSKNIYESTIYAGTNAEGGKEASITIKNGFFRNEGDGEYKWKKGWKPIVLNVYNEGSPSQIKVENGKFYSQDPSLGDDKLGGTFVADGSRVEIIEDGYEVLKVNQG